MALLFGAWISGPGIRNQLVLKYIFLQILSNACPSLISMDSKIVHQSDEDTWQNLYYETFVIKSIKLSTVGETL